ncbi:MAG: tRNA modification GTPase [Alphaproteobacteria bacterium]|nr:tRNA modification GTPase [Alphaproteobacteria bacterium]
MTATPTLVAPATPWGRSAVAVVRLSGPAARDIVARLAPAGPPWRARRASVRTLCDADGRTLDRALVTWMPGPRSYTGQDVVELSLHGNPAIVAAVIDACVAAGARVAGPGAFTRQAVEAGRLGLLEAEAVDAVVRASTVEGARLALDRGGLGEVLAGWRTQLVEVAAELEARLDHPGEELGLAEDEALAAGLSGLHAQAQALAATWGPARARIDGAVVALIGPVNAGKSSLLNALVGQTRALVSDQPGTTRDVVEARIDLDGVALTLLDTAGAREHATELEAQGAALAQARLADTDLVLVVESLAAPADPAVDRLLAGLGDRPRLRIGTHLDRAAPRPEHDLALSTVTGQGLPALRDALRRATGELSQAAAAVLVSERQHGRVLDVADHLAHAALALADDLGPAVAAQELYLALSTLDALSGADTREDVLDRLFARFCIGK